MPVRGAGMGSIHRAFSFAVARLAPSIHPSGIFSLYATFLDRSVQKGRPRKLPWRLAFSPCSKEIH